MHMKWEEGRKTNKKLEKLYRNYLTVLPLWILVILL
jgi:hypothetical protein